LQTSNFKPSFPRQLYIQFANQLNQPICHVCHSTSYVTCNNFQLGKASLHVSTFFHYKLRITTVLECLCIHILSACPIWSSSDSSSKVALDQALPRPSHLLRSLQHYYHFMTMSHHLTDNYCPWDQTAPFYTNYSTTRPSNLYNSRQLAEPSKTVP